MENNNNQTEFSHMPQSYWIASASDLSDKYPELKEDIKTDAVIVGGGIAGITCAYLLQKEGIRTAILEADRICRGTTGHTTAKITSQHELTYHKIKTKMGEEFAYQYSNANQTAIDEIRKLKDELKIDCDFISQSAFAFTEREENIQNIIDEANTATSLGLNAAYVEELPFPIPVKAAVRFDGQAQFHPLKYALALAKEFLKNGGQIYEQTRVVEVDEQDGYTVTTEPGRKVTAERLIIASHYPFYNKHGMYFSRIYEERSYVVAVSTAEKYPGGMYINVEDPTRSLRSQSFEDGELILVGGEHHKTGQGPDTTKHYEALSEFAHRIFNVKDMPFRWSTQDCMTVDGLPYVGQFTADTKNLYVATGFGKWGMTNSMASAMLLRDLIVKGDSPWKEVYSPSRHTVAASTANFVVQNCNVAAKLVEGKLEQLPKDDSDILPGEGKAIRLDGKRAGAYRDENGILFIVNTTCTHMGCELNWNQAERTWDCPCHGSRFSYDGKILEGPAVAPLTMDHDVKTLGKLINEDF